MSEATNDRLNPVPSGDFSIHRAHRTTPFTMPLNHYHEAYEIYYMRSGERYYFIKDRTYRIQPGDLVLIDKHVLHKTQHITKSHERILLHYRDGFLDPLLGGAEWSPASIFEHPVVRLTMKQQSYVESLLDRLLEESRLPTPESPIYIKVTLAELLLYTARCIREQTHAAVRSEPANPMFERISAVAAYINDHYANDLSLTLLSGLFHINPHYLSRIFNKVTGFSFVEYVTLVRLKEAQKLLLAGDKNVTEVAETVGFESLSHFGRVFKASMGMSPKDYRKIYGS
ncbi:helix-turn-helix domain-containing protein [Paenibacillus ginsengarvi]|uniref:AraC family transcriptional regulator n=1 Tax=Paenibacillus ginsengarvi TaxID=400777 RepID=A0A3B0CKD1_9BACL|nr:AraC family transcriptional regulator [Paenibacillus ginsengarvi]RKN84994.1 AraC family transcriptional regulator [Paenibacillus ginsengarvi]